MCVSQGPVRETEAVRVIDILQRIGLHDCEVWLRKSETCRTDRQGGQDRISRNGVKLLSSGRISSRKPQLCF